MISGAEAEAEEHVEEQEPAAAEAPVAARKGCNQRKGGQLGALSQLETNLSEGMMTSDPRAEAERSRLLEIVREAQRRDGERLPTEQPRHMQLEAAVELASSRLEAMSYQALLAERGAWLRLPVAALPPPDVGKGDKQRGWRLAWPPQLEALLRDRPVRKRFGAHGTWLGRVVGSFEAFFQVLYEDGDSEEVDLFELRALLVPHATRDDWLSRLVKAHEHTSGSSSRPKRSRVARDLERDAEDYVRRTGCHNSLPEGNMACHLHEAMRRSGEFGWVDPGPEKSD